jgi:TetR/AcrR family transcriptional repressor of nem operon
MRSPDTRERIVTTALDLFHHRSYSGVGVKEICDSAGIQKGSFYHFFPSKRDVAMAVVDRMAEVWAERVVAQAFDPKTAPLARLDRLIELSHAWQCQVRGTDGAMPGCLFGNLALEVSTSDEVLRAHLAAVFRRAAQPFRATLEEAVSAGTIEPLDTQRTAEAMLAYLEGVLLMAKAHKDPGLVLTLGAAIKTLRVERMD